MKLTKDEVLENIDEVRKYVEEIDSKKDVKKVGFTIKTTLGSVIFESEKTTCREAVLDAIESGADLSDADLSDAKLSGADLSYTDLSGANLSYTDLSDANLSCAKLSCANLSGANLSYTDLSGAKTEYAKVNFSSSEYEQAKQFIEGLRR